LLTRTSKNKINKILEENSKWKILDIGCGYRAHDKATTIADVQDFSNYYKDKKFIQIKEKKLPFDDNEFDFVIASHVIEHVNDFQFFIKEIERISSKGYIELPTRLADNLVFENKTDHVWWFFFDDINNELIVSEKKNLIDPFISVSMSKTLEETFRDSLLIELYWEKKIEYKITNKDLYGDFKKISFLKIVKKYLSKKLRSFIK
jgi:SAM-dependent methyltransferase